MATRTKPLISAAALASAAAVALVSPGVAPSLNTPAPGALSRAAYELVNFRDVLSVPSVAWTDLLFGNTSWGGVLGPDNYGPDWAAPQDVLGQYGYVNPWAAYCSNNCDQSGITGAAYLFFDALVNGGGEGYDNSDQWKIGLVNYLFEPNSVFQLGGGSSPYLQYVSEGFSAATWYALQGTIGRLIPGATVPLASAFWGPANVSVLYNFTLSIAAQLIGVVPLVGPVVGNTILAYLGDLALEQGTQSTYQYGLSGAINYVVDLATGAVPWPKKVPWYTIPSGASAAAALAAAAIPSAAPAAEAATVTGPEVAADAPESTPAATALAKVGAPESTPAVDAPESTPAVDAPESTPAADVVENTPAVNVPESTPAVDTPAAPAVDVPAAEVADSAPAAAPAAPKRPLRDALGKVSKQVASAVGGSQAGKTGRAKAKAGAAE